MYALLVHVFNLFHLLKLINNNLFVIWLIVSIRFNFLTVILLEWLGHPIAIAVDPVPLPV